MRYFPVFFDLEKAKVVVVGGGEEALRKIRLLLKTGAQIEVVAPQNFSTQRIRSWLSIRGRE